MRRFIPALALSTVFGYGGAASAGTIAAVRVLTSLSLSGSHLIVPTLPPVALKMTSPLPQAAEALVLAAGTPVSLNRVEAPRPLSSIAAPAQIRIGFENQPHLTRADLRGPVGTVDFGFPPPIPRDLRPSRQDYAARFDNARQGLSDIADPVPVPTQTLAAPSSHLRRRTPMPLSQARTLADLMDAEPGTMKIAKINKGFFLFVIPDLEPAPGDYAPHPIVYRVAYSAELSLTETHYPYTVRRIRDKDVKPYLNEFGFGVVDVATIRDRRAIEDAYFPALNKGLLPAMPEDMMRSADANIEILSRPERRGDGRITLRELGFAAVIASAMLGAFFGAQAAVDHSGAIKVSATNLYSQLSNQHSPTRHSAP